MMSLIVSAFRKRSVRLMFSSLLVLELLLPTLARSAAEGTSGPDPAMLKEMRQRAVNFLRTTQSDSGGWTSDQVPGISGLIVYSLLASGVLADDPMVAKGLKYLEGFVQDDGGVYYKKSNHRNYETAIALLAFNEANKTGRYDEMIAGAESSSVAYSGTRERAWRPPIRPMAAPATAATRVPTFRTRSSCWRPSRPRAPGRTIPPFRKR